MENTKTRDSILKMMLNSFKDMFIESKDNTNSLPKMMDLKSDDWKFVSDAEKKELLMNSPKRLKDIVNKFFDKSLSKKKRTAFASGTSLSNDNPKIELRENEKENEGFEIGE